MTPIAQLCKRRIHVTRQSLFIFSVGPVQDFIASARKCRDLWFGSWLLSEVSRHIAGAIEDRCGADALIFPGSRRWQKEEPIANKIVALVNSDDVKAIVDDCQDAARAFLDDKVEGISEELKHMPNAQLLREGPQALEETREIAERQIADLLELFWVAVPMLPEESGGYEKTRKRAEGLLSARKNTRDWQPSSWGSPEFKSSLDGNREAIVRLPNKEYLCAIGLLKRQTIGKKRHQFHSSSHVAARPLLGAMENQDAQEAFDHFQKKIADAIQSTKVSDALLEEFEIRGFSGLHGRDQKQHFDGALLFPGRVLSSYQEVTAEKPDREEIGNAVRQLARDLGIKGDPNPYYALVLADGDRMGQLIGELGSFARHQEFSGALAGFAHGVGSTTKEHQGSLIYAGGDDVLALVPLHRLLEYVRCLADDFAQCLEPFGKATLSVGVAIVHHTLHFGTVRSIAKQAEALAKQERNSLAIIMDKRSGGSRSVAGTWEPDNDGIPLDQRLSQWITRLAAQDIPHGFIRELEQLASFAEVGSPTEDLNKVILSEVERIMERKKPGSGSNEPGLGNDVRDLIREPLMGHNKSSPIGERIRALASELTIALELHRVRQQALQTQEIGETCP